MLNLIDGHFPPQADFINARALAASTPEDSTIPAGARYVMLTGTDRFYFRMWGGGTLAVPADVTDGSAAELAPSGTTVIRAIDSASTTGTVAASSASLTVASTDGFTINDTIVVKGAGAAGANHSTTISAINHTTKVITLAAVAVTAVTDATVTLTIDRISVISPATCIVTLSYYK